MNDNHVKTAPIIAKLINYILIIIVAILVIGILAMLGFAIMMQFPNELRDSVMSKLEATGGDLPSLSALSINSVMAAIMAAAYLYVALVVKAIVKTTLEGDPFVEANISRLRTTWIVIALAEIFRMIVMGFLPGHTNGEAALDNFSVDTRLSAWFLVFVIAAMAEVFRIGLELRRDQELTV